MIARRGFTLLEVIAAGVLGSLLVLVVFGLMGALARGDRASQERRTHVDTMLRVQTVMERVFQGLVMGDQTDALRAVQAGVMPATDNTPQQADVAPDAIRTEAAEEPPPRPRFMLEVDPRVRSGGAWRVGSSSSSSSGGAVQRLEVVLNKPPIPRDWAATVAGEVMPEATTAETAGLTRGVFELRPDDASLPTAEDGGWTLWWRTLPLKPTTADGDELGAEPSVAGGAVPLASGLAGVQWLAFKGGTRVSALSAVQMLDLPGYVEMQIRTLGPDGQGGVSSTWMFEIGWSVVPEREPAAAGPSGQGATLEEAP
jgi:type II secretory pathway pseudopilin PulG